MVLLYCFVGDVLFKYLLMFIGSTSSYCHFVFFFYYYFLFSNFIFLMFFKEQMFYILKKPNLSIFFFYVLCFFVLCRKPLHMSEFKDFTYAYSRNSIALNQYSFFFFSWRYWVDIALSVEKAFVFSIELLWLLCGKINWLYVHWSISRLLSVLLIFIYLFI